MAKEKAKEDLLRKAMVRVEGTQNELNKQKTRLVGELDGVYGHMEQDANCWCKKHVDKLLTISNGKQKNLDFQVKKLQNKADALAEHQRAISSRMEDAHTAVDKVPLYLMLLKKVSEWWE